MASDKDTANISVGLSSQLINVAITLMAIAGAFFTFIFDKKDPSVAFHCVYTLIFLSLITSLYCGGRGIDTVKINGEAGNWVTRQNGKTNWFNRQAITLVIGIVSIGVLPFLGKEKKKEEDKAMFILQRFEKRDSILTEYIKQANLRESTKNPSLNTKKSMPSS